jgi:hypothetical protein
MVALRRHRAVLAALGAMRWRLSHKGAVLQDLRRANRVFATLVTPRGPARSRGPRTSRPGLSDAALFTRHEEGAVGGRASAATPQTQRWAGSPGTCRCSAALLTGGADPRLLSPTCGHVDDEAGSATPALLREADRLFVRLADFLRWCRWALTGSD